MPTGSFQTLTLEYRVHGEFDGATLAPPFADGEVDGSQIVVFDVQNLGVIPFIFGQDAEPAQLPACPAATFVTWTLLYGRATAQNVDSGISVAVVMQGAVPTVESIGTIPAAARGLYLRRCIEVPQGGVMVIRDIQASGGFPAIARLRIQRPEASEQKSLLGKACCCKGDLPRIVVPNIRT